MVKMTAKNYLKSNKTEEECVDYLIRFHKNQTSNSFRDYIENHILGMRKFSLPEDILAFVSEKYNIIIDDAKLLKIYDVNTQRTYALYTQDEFCLINDNRNKDDIRLTMRCNINELNIPYINEKENYYEVFIKTNEYNFPLKVTKLLFINKKQLTNVLLNKN